MPKIQGLLNECMTFLDDELSTITGPYDNPLSINDVINQELILFVSLNIDKHGARACIGEDAVAEPATGRRQALRIGDRAEPEEPPAIFCRHRRGAPFGYRNFAQILNTARGTNTAFLFSMQSLPQLLQVGKSLPQQDVSSAPGTAMLLQTRDEETAKYSSRRRRKCRCRSGHSNCGAKTFWDLKTSKRRRAPRNGNT